MTQTHLTPGHFDAHIYAFWNAPLSQRPGWTRHQLALVNARLAEGGYPSADAYYSDKDWARELSAGLRNLKPWQYDPMGWHFGMQSN